MHHTLSHAPLLTGRGSSKDYRGIPAHPASASTTHPWECGWKGWQWHEHHDLLLMGYSLRVAKWRYTAWVLWNPHETEPIWTYPPFGEELYAHPLGADEPPHRSKYFEHFEFYEEISNTPHVHPSGLATSTPTATPTTVMNESLPSPPHEVRT